MTDLTLYLDMISQPSRAVYIFAKANNIPFNFHEVCLLKGDQLTEEFAKVNPNRKIPALKDGDFTLAESTAMLLYMTNKYKTPDHWYPSDLQKRARVDEYLAWQHSTIRRSNSKFFCFKCISPLVDLEIDSKKLDAALAEFNTTIENVEDNFLRDKPFIAGDTISIADLVAIAEIMQGVGSGVKVFESSRRLAAWKQRVVEAVGEELFMEAHKIVLHFEDMKTTPPTLTPAAKGQCKYIVEGFC
ncbi:glutathione S-transferase theta-1-like [Hyperolius riggenbachi]|uniref:glutathione S-transferase theta-1-like n=1 Tax=Hyperolius riggenbachi TaxID=752182 RepID=UPI0035A2B13B